MDNLVQSTVLGIKKGSQVEDMLDQITLDQTSQLFQKAKQTVLLDEAERKWQMKKQRQQRYCACTCFQKMFKSRVDKSPGEKKAMKEQ